MTNNENKLLSELMVRNKVDIEMFTKSVETIIGISGVANFGFKVVCLFGATYYRDYYGKIISVYVKLRPNNLFTLDGAISFLHTALMRFNKATGFIKNHSSEVWFYIATAIVCSRNIDYLELSKLLTEANKRLESYNQERGDVHDDLVALTSFVNEKSLFISALIIAADYEYRST